MKDIYEAKSQIEDEAIEFLRNGIYAEHPNDCPDYLNCRIKKRDKDCDLEQYEKDLIIFKTLFNAGNENYKIALWNGLRFYSDNVEVYETDFSYDELAFIKKRIKVSGTIIEKTNVNKPIKSERLILRAVTEDDSKLLAYHYKHDGDFIMFCGFNPTGEYIRIFADRQMPLFFMIEEKHTHNAIGYVGLTLKEVSATGLLEYYIFKEYRKQGYCKEAVKTLVNVALADKLYEPKETVRDDVYSKKTMKFNAIRAGVSTVNTASLKTVESCGFIYEATLHKTLHKEGIGWTDEKIYYIPKEL
ncbi:MAG: GNAT family N-acetyltransferase [Anaeroplasmataceae bacterium]|nr:GNAT family N-acetyltransferase [Anaeroplasmataceae bacterium]MDE6413909.1 GNAT family N-acetyltransferase [Anaeroplasmataceae bacterium]